MKIGVTGITGFLGRQVAKAAREAGHEVVGFSRSGSPHRTFSIERPADCSGLDAVIHLAGESILGLWTAKKKQRILRSRREGTRQIVAGLAAANPRPATLVCASAIGFYGDTGERIVDEKSAAGSGFLADVTRQWEAAATEAEALGIRVVRLRIGFVIGHGGALSLIAPVFRLGLGGPLGNGKQWMSGIHAADVAGLAVFCAGNPAVSGPVNAVMPEPFRNADFTRAVARAVRRPAIFPVPAFVLRLALGELSSLLLGNSRVVCSNAGTAEYAFAFPNLDRAVADATRKPPG